MDAHLNDWGEYVFTSDFIRGLLLSDLENEHGRKAEDYSYPRDCPSGDGADFSPYSFTQFPTPAPCLPMQRYPGLDLDPYRSPRSNGTASTPDGAQICAPSPFPTEGTRSSTEVRGNDDKESYAQLIYRALMSTKPLYAMTLQEIYAWFRENTDKGKSDSTGWQNSIRHNLSMNHAFTKTERKWSSNGEASEDHKDTTKPAEITLPSAITASDLNFSAADSKKSTKWYLEPWAVSGGVQSTTRYRKNNKTSTKGNMKNARDPAHPSRSG